MRLPESRFGLWVPSLAPGCSLTVDPSALHAFRRSPLSENTNSQSHSGSRDPELCHNFVLDPSLLRANILTKHVGRVAESHQYVAPPSGNLMTNILMENSGNSTTSGKSDLNLEGKSKDEFGADAARINGEVLLPLALFI